MQDQVQFGYEMREVEEQALDFFFLAVFGSRVVVLDPCVICVTDVGLRDVGNLEAEVAAQALSEHMMSLKLWDE